MSNIECCRALKPGLDASQFLGTLVGRCSAGPQLPCSTLPCLGPSETCSRLQGAAPNGERHARACLLTAQPLPQLA